MPPLRTPVFGPTTTKSAKVVLGAHRLADHIATMCRISLDIPKPKRTHLPTTLPLLLSIWLRSGISWGSVMKKMLLLLFAMLMIPAPAFALGQVYDLKANFGAACDGVTDDTVKIQNWLNAISDLDKGTVPPGLCVFTSPLTKNGQGYSIVGSGSYATIFQYKGVNTTSDLLLITNSSGEAKNIVISGIKIISATTMTNGAAFHFRDFVRSNLYDIIAGGQDNPGTLFHGFWFDRVDSVYVNQMEANAQGDCVRVNGGVGPSAKADLGLAQGKIGGCGVGIHVGGAFGGLFVDQMDIISNKTNLLIDNALAAEGNREIMMGSTSVLDSATLNDSVYINDIYSGGGSITLGGWIATGPKNGVNIVKWSGGTVNLNGNQLFNFTNDGVRVSDNTTIVKIDTGLAIRNNGGYGVNATVVTNNIYPGSRPISNSLGAYSLNSHVEYYGPYTGYKKYPNGTIEQWGYVTLTGAANTFISGSVTFPITFPNAGTQGITEAGGFPNGAVQRTTSIESITTTGAQIFLVSAGTVSAGQPVNYRVWGY